MRVVARNVVKRKLHLNMHNIKWINWVLGEAYLWRVHKDRVSWYPCNCICDIAFWKKSRTWTMWRILRLCEEMWNSESVENMWDPESDEVRTWDPHFLMWGILRLYRHTGSFQIQILLRCSNICIMYILFDIVAPTGCATHLSILHA